jgi:hypothetical protein
MLMLLKTSILILFVLTAAEEGGWCAGSPEACIAISGDASRDSSTLLQTRASILEADEVVVKGSRIEGGDMMEKLLRKRDATVQIQGQDSRLEEDVPMAMASAKTKVHNIHDRSSLSEEVECTGDYGAPVGSAVCCGQSGTISEAKHICPASLPQCEGFIQGAQWGICQALKIRKKMNKRFRKNKKKLVACVKKVKGRLANYYKGRCIAFRRFCRHYRKMKHNAAKYYCRKMRLMHRRMKHHHRRHRHRL